MEFRDILFFRRKFVCIERSHKSIFAFFYSTEVLRVNVTPIGRNSKNKKKATSNCKGSYSSVTSYKKYTRYHSLFIYSYLYTVCNLMNSSSFKSAYDTCFPRFSDRCAWKLYITKWVKYNTLLKCFSYNICECSLAWINLLRLRLYS